MSSEASRALAEDVEGVSSDVYDETSFIVTATTENETRELLNASPTQVVHDVVSAAFKCLPDELDEVLLGDNVVQPGERFEDWGIEVTHTVDRPPRRITGGI